MSGDFYDERFPDDIASGSFFAPEYSNSTAKSNNGSRQTNRNRIYPLGRGDIRPGIKDNDGFHRFANFYHEVGGSWRGFRFRDIKDYKCEGSQGVLERIGVTNTYQMLKAYNTTARRKITRLVSGKVTIFGGGTYSFDINTGIVTHTSGAAPTGHTCWFDKPVHFVDDQLPLTWIKEWHTELGAVEIEEDLE